MDISTWTNVKLKDHLRKLGIKVSGNKSDLIKRIQEHDSSKYKYSKMTVKKLQGLLRERKLSPTGKKDVLISRLETNDTSPGIKASPKKQTSPRRNASPIKSHIDEIPDELLLEILQNLNDKDLANTCRTDKRAAQLCKDNTFWKNRIKNIFDINLNITEEDNVTYETLYKFLKKNDKFGINTKLHNAFRIGYSPIIRYILEDLQYDTQKALEVSASSGSVGAFKYMLNKGGNVFATNELEETPFFTAAMFGKLNIVKYIMKNLNPDIADINEILMYTTQHRDGIEILKYLLNTVNGLNLDLALVNAVKAGVVQAVRILLAKGANPDANRRLAFRIAESTRYRFPLLKYVNAVQTLRKSRLYR